MSGCRAAIRRRVVLVSQAELLYGFGFMAGWRGLGAGGLGAGSWVTGAGWRELGGAISE
jgi:hypothetical protein